MLERIARQDNILSCGPREVVVAKLLDPEALRYVFAARCSFWSKERKAFLSTGTGIWWVSMSLDPGNIKDLQELVE